MSDSGFSEDDDILGEFVHEMSKTQDETAKQRIVLRYVTKHPRLQKRILQLAGMERVLEQTQQSADIPELPREFGEFLIIRRIGHDGMGEIYEAYHERLDRRVAIKIIRRGWASDEANQRFNREQLVLAKLHQTHIVPIHTAGEHDGVQYFAMPYIEGASLNFVVQAAREHHSTKSGSSTPSVGRFAEVAVSRMKTAGSATQGPSGSEKSTAGLGEGEKASTEDLVQPIRFWKEYHTSVAGAIADVAEAVSYAHAAGILHRDIKPHNIMIEPNGHIWVIDFGLAGFLKRDSDTGPAADADSDGAKTVQSFDENPQLTQGMGGGTPSFLAPERWEGGKASEQSDVWALGATLYELLTLHRAFEGPSWKVIRAQILKHAPKAPKELVAGLPVDLAAICRKSMERDPGQRYQTAAALAGDLRRWLNHEPTTALPARAPRRAMLWCRRNPGWASLIGAMMLMTTLLVGASASAAAKEMVHQRQMGIRTIERIQSTTHATGWSDEIWNYGTNLPALEGEADLRDALATSLIDVDAEELYDDKSTEADLLAFNETGERLVCGGSTDDNGNLRQPPKVLDVKTRQWHESTVNGSGPVAFNNDGVPVVLVPDAENACRVRLFDVNTSQEITSFLRDGPAETLTSDNRPVLVLSTDATFAVFATPLAPMPLTKDSLKRPFEVDVWNTSTSERIYQCRVEDAASLAITPDGKTVAVGQRNGQIGLWSIGNPDRFAELPHGRSQILSLAFARDYLRRFPIDAQVVPANGWLLASGDSTGSVIVWDVTQRQRRTVMRGSYYEVSNLAFSSDSALLFSVGRSPGKIWDVATGEKIFTWNQSNYLPGLAVTRSGMFASSGLALKLPSARSPTRRPLLSALITVNSSAAPAIGP